MDQIILLIIAAFLSLAMGSVLGYYVRQSLAKKRAGSLEEKLQKKVIQVKEETTATIKRAEAKAIEITDRAQKEIDERRREFLKSQQILLNRENLLETKLVAFDLKEAELKDKVEKLKEVKDELSN